MESRGPDQRTHCANCECELTDFDGDNFCAACFRERMLIALKAVQDVLDEEEKIGHA